MAERKNIESLTSETTELKREISLFGGISILGGIMIGSGVFYLGSYVLMRSGMSMGLALLVWVLGGVVTLISGLCYAELGTMMPKAGGGYVYLREAYGERVAYMSGMSTFILGSSGSIAGLAIAFPKALGSLVPITDVQSKAIAVALVILLSLVNLRGVKLGSLIQNVFMVAKVIPLVVIIGAGLLMGKQTPDLSIMPASSPSPTTLLSMVAFAVVATLWAYEGWTNLNTISEEMKNPKRNIPLAIIISILGVTCLYTVFNLAIYRVVPMETIQQHFVQENFYLGTEAANILFGSWGRYIVGIGMAVAIFGSLNGCVMVFPRTYYAMAKDGLLFSSFGKLHPTYKTPVGAIIGSAVVSCVLIFSRNLDQLTSLVVFSGMVFKTLTFYSVITLRKKYPDLPRPYKVAFYPALVYLNIVIMVGLMANTLIEDPVTSVIGLVVPAAGWVVYEFISRRGGRAKAR